MRCAGVVELRSIAQAVAAEPVAGCWWWTLLIISARNSVTVSIGTARIANSQTNQPWAGTTVSVVWVVHRAAAAIAKIPEVGRACLRCAGVVELSAIAHAVAAEPVAG